MAEKDDKIERLGSFDTLPPPASGDAYSAETVQRVVPPELLAEAKRELLKRGPRSSQRKPAPPPPPSPSPLAAPPVPVIERISFEDDDSAGDEAETLMRPADLDRRSTPEPAPLGAAVGRSPPAAGPVSPAAPLATVSERLPEHSQLFDGWLGSVLIFAGAMLLVLLLGLLLIKLVV